MPAGAASAHHLRDLTVVEAGLGGRKRGGPRVKRNEGEESTHRGDKEQLLMHRDCLFGSAIIIDRIPTSHGIAGEGNPLDHAARDLGE
jgi:hypothetical protein